MEIQFTKVGQMPITENDLLSLKAYIHEDGKRKIKTKLSNMKTRYPDRFSRLNVEEGIQFIHQFNEHEGPVNTGKPKKSSNNE